jgi:hypothetical protein
VFVSDKDEQAMAAILRELSAAQSQLSEVALVLYLPSSDSSLLPVFHRFMVSERDHALPSLRLATRGFPLRAFQPKFDDEPELVAAELISFVRRHSFDITNGWYDALEEITENLAESFHSGVPIRQGRDTVNHTAKRGGHASASVKSAPKYRSQPHASNLAVASSSPQPRIDTDKAASRDPHAGNAAETPAIRTSLMADAEQRSDESFDSGFASVKRSATVKNAAGSGVHSSASVNPVPKYRSQPRAATVKAPSPDLSPYSHTENAEQTQAIRFHLDDAESYQDNPVPLRVLVFVSDKDEQAMAAILRELSAAQSQLSEVALVLYLPSSDSSLLPVFHRFMVSERDHALPSLRLATRGFPLRAFQPKFDDEPELVAAELISFVRRHSFDITNGWYDALEEVTLDEAVDFENGRLESRVCLSPPFARAEHSLLLALADYSTQLLALAMIGRRSSLCRVAAVVWSTAQEALAESRRN